MKRRARHGHQLAVLSFPTRRSSDLSSYSDSISFQSPSKGQQTAGSLSTRISGDAHDGIYEAKVTIQAYSEQGTMRRAHLQTPVTGSTSISSSASNNPGGPHPTPIHQ